MTVPSWVEEPRGDVRRTVEVVVVGSGAGGAFAALTFAEAGFDTLVVEEGFSLVPGAAPPNIAPAMAAYYQEGGFRTMGGTPPIPLAGGRAVGGSTVVNSAICFRTPETSLAEWNERSGGGFADVAAYYRTMDAVEALIGVAETPQHLLSGLDRAHQRAAQRLSWSNHPFRRNTPTCVGCGRCNSGCPSGGKASVDRAVLPRAAAAGVRVLSGARIDAVRTGGVRGVLVDRSGAEVGTLDIGASTVVLCGGTVGSPRLLLDSGLAPRAAEVGRGLLIHPVFSVAGLSPDGPLVAPGASQGHYIDAFADERFLLESNPTIPGAIFQSLPLWGREGAPLLRKTAWFANTGVMVRDEGGGRVLASGGLGARVHYDLHEADRRRAVAGMLRAAELWFSGLDAEVVGLGVYGARLCKSMDDARMVLRDDLEPNRLMGYSSHPQATCPVGRSLEHDGRLRGVDGVYVMDGSSLPGNVGRNPQISIMTVARTLAERAVQALGKVPRPLWEGPAPLWSVPQHGVPCGLSLPPSAPLPVIGP